MKPTTKKIINAVLKSPNCSRLKTAGKIVAKREPIVGIKFSKKMRNAKKQCFFYVPHYKKSMFAKYKFEFDH